MAARVLPEDLKKRYVLDEFVLEPDLRRLCRADAPVHLAHRPFQALLYLIEHRDRMVSRAELLDQFWEGRDVYDATLSKCVGAIRRALGDTLDQPRFIETRWAEGYRYIGPLEEQTIESEPATLAIERTRAVRIVVEEERQEATASQLSFTVSQPSRRVVMLALVLAAVTLAGIAFAFTRSRPNPDPNLPIRSLAVLPLKNLSGDPAQDYFSDGLTESFITELAKIRGLQVVSRGSAFAFRGREADPREVGRKLNVAAVLEGSVRASGDRVRVEVRLVNTANGHVIWAGDSYEHALSDIFAVQQQIACSVAEELRARLCDEPAPRRPARYTGSVEAYQAYLRGRYQINNQYGAAGPERALRQAAEHFERAVRIDPHYAPAWAGLADACTQLIWFAQEPRALIARARTAALRAVELDETLAEAHTSLGTALLHDWQFEAAGRAFERAIALNPGDAWIHHEYSTWLGAVGRGRESLAEIRRAEELDPLNVMILVDRGNTLISSGRCDEALAQFRRAAELDPHSPGGMNLAECYARQGDYLRAIRETEAALQSGSRNAYNIAALAVWQAAVGNRREAERRLAELTEMSKREYVPKSCFAWVCAALGRKDEALAILEAAYRDHDVMLLGLRDPRFAPLHGDARFQNLLQRVGLEGK